MATSTPFWALIELMGQQRAVGLCSWKDGGKLHVDLLGADGRVKFPPSTFGPCALYRVVEVTEEVAVATAAKMSSVVSHLPYWAEKPVPPAAPMPELRVGMHVVWDLSYGRVLHVGNPLVVLEQVVNGRIVDPDGKVKRFTDRWANDDSGWLQIRKENHEILWTRPGCTTVYDNDSCPPIPF